MLDILIIAPFIIIVYIVAKSNITIKKSILKILNFISMLFFATDIPDFEDKDIDNTK